MSTRINTLFCDVTNETLHSHLKKYNIINFPKSNLILKILVIMITKQKKEKNTYIFNINTNKNY